MGIAKEGVLGAYFDFQFGSSCQIEHQSRGCDFFFNKELLDGNFGFNFWRDIEKNTSSLKRAIQRGQRICLFFERAGEMVLQEDPIGAYRLIQRENDDSLRHPRRRVSKKSVDK